MLRALVVLALVFVAAALVLLAVLAMRRVVLGRRERRYAEASRRVRPFAIALVEGENTDAAAALPVADQAVLADVLGRYSRALSGEADARIAAHFRDSAAFERAVADLGARRVWRRAAAAYRLGDMGCAEAAPALLAALDDGKREVRAAAAHSLGRLRVVEAALPLVEAVVIGRVPNGVAGGALVELGAAAVPELRRIAANHDERVRTVAVTLLGLVGDPRDSAAVVAALADESADVRRAAATSLARIGTAGSEPPLRAALDDPMHFVRAAAATALGALGSRAALPRLIDMARTDRFRPARAAAHAVVRIDPARVVLAAEQPDAGAHLHEAADLVAQ
jgi:HEAT repeat protein